MIVASNSKVGENSIIVTGASGLVGKKVVETLAERGDEAIAVVRKIPCQPVKNVDYLELNLAEPNLAESLPRQAKGVIHLAQSRRYRDFPDSVLDVFGVNTTASVELVSYANEIGAKSFVYASSGAVYGMGRGLYREDDFQRSVNPSGFYARTKLSAEILLECYRELLSVVVLRPFFVYGPGQDDGMLFPRLLKSVTEGQPVRLQGKEGLVINPIFVEDAASMVVKSLDLKSSRTINVAGSEEVSLKALVFKMGKLMGRKPKFYTVEGGSQRLIGDTRLMKQLLGVPVVGLDEGLSRIIR